MPNGRKKAQKGHRIKLLEDKESMSLCLMGEKSLEKGIEIRSGERIREEIYA